MMDLVERLINLNNDCLREFGQGLKVIELDVIPFYQGIVRPFLLDMERLPPTEAIPPIISELTIMSVGGPFLVRLKTKPPPDQVK